MIYKEKVIQKFFFPNNADSKIHSSWLGIFMYQVKKICFNNAWVNKPMDSKPNLRFVALELNKLGHFNAASC